MKKGNSCPVPHKKRQDDADKTNYATIDREKTDINPDLLEDADEEALAEGVNAINPDMNSMDSRG